MNKKKWYLVLTVLLVLIVGFGILKFFAGTATPNSNVALSVFDPLNTTYNIESQPVTLVNGTAQVEAAPGSASKVTTTVFGSPVAGDINGDGKPDAALILVQSGGGSGTFYYAVAALNNEAGIQGTNGIFLGDRIAPENISITDQNILVNYADRGPTEPMSATPSIGMSKYMVYDGSVLKEVSSTNP